MSQREIRYSLSLIDLYTMIFTRKRCLRCGGGLVRESEETSTGPKMQVETEGFGFRAWYGNRTDVTVCYVCRACSLRYTLGQLRRGESGEPLANKNAGVEA